MRSVLSRFSEAWDHFPDVLRLAIQTTSINVETKLARDNAFVAERRECFSDKRFACIWTVHFGCIEERDAFFIGCTNDLDALVLICGRPVVGADAHASKPQLRNFQLS